MPIEREASYETVATGTVEQVFECSRPRCFCCELPCDRDDPSGNCATMDHGQTMPPWHGGAALLRGARVNWEAGGLEAQAPPS